MIGDAFSAVAGTAGTIVGVAEIAGAIGSGAGITVGSGGTAAGAGVMISVAGVTQGATLAVAGSAVASGAMGNFFNSQDKYYEAKADRMNADSSGGGGAGGAGKTGNIEQHHQLPKQFKQQFTRAGLDIEDYKIPLDQSNHRLKPDGLHTGSNNWNKQWEDFFSDNPDAIKNDILNQLDTMQKYFGIK
jgi:hypothetical protein